MARFVQRRHEQPDAELNLTPIMNVVLILIPLLLIAVVFTEITVIDVAMPPRGERPHDDGQVPVKPPHVIVGERGIQVVAAEAVVSPDARCDGMTLCARTEATGVARYDWVALYNTLLELKRRPEYADIPGLSIVAEPHIGWDVIVRLMDVARFQLAEPGTDATRGVPMPDHDALARARPVVTTDRATGQRMQLGLFVAPTLGAPVE